MPTNKWGTPEGTTIVLANVLNGLANGAMSVESDPVDNQTSRYMFMALELYLTTLTPVGAPTVNVYLVPSIGNISYADPGSLDNLCAVFSLSTGSGVKRRVLYNIRIPPLRFKFVVQNLSGTAFNASGNTLSYNRYNVELVP